MTSQKIAAYYYPTTVILVDDNKRFLSTVCFDLEEDVAYRLFDKPEEALRYLKQEYKLTPLIDQVLSASNESNIHLGIHHDISLNITAIHQAIFNAYRYSEIAVILVDYNMPQINGLDFCKQLAELPIKKILITAAADERIAVKAFNQGIINKFILKSDPDFAATINSSIVELQHNYFQDLSEGIIKALLVDKNCVLNKSSFADFFRDFCAQQHITEFYLYDPSGSYLLLDSLGNPSWLVVKTAVDLDDYYDFANDSDASATVLEQLKTGKMIPFFPKARDLEKVHGKEWENYLYPAKRLKADTTFFYAHIQNKPEFLPNYQKITSYTNYLNRLWPNFLSKRGK